jgi:hypothetical protein
MTDHPAAEQSVYKEPYHITTDSTIEKKSTVAARGHKAVVLTALGSESSAASRKKRRPPGRRSTWGAALGSKRPAKPSGTCTQKGKSHTADSQKEDAPPALTKPKFGGDAHPPANHSNGYCRIGLVSVLCEAHQQRSGKNGNRQADRRPDLYA